jgi:hypothetical protein
MAGASLFRVEFQADLGQPLVLPLQIVDNSSGLLEWLKRGCQQDAGDRAGHTRADFRRCPLVRRPFSTARRAKATLPAEGS